VLKLADYAIKIEKHYSNKAGQPRPMDMEWAKDGVDGLLYIVQARPETVVSQRNSMIMESYALKDKAVPIVIGHAVGSKIATGKARIIEHLDQLKEFKPGDVLVAEITTPDWEPVMKIASASLIAVGVPATRRLSPVNWACPPSSVAKKLPSPSKTTQK
jgi:pyruvate,water dikinase